MKPTTEKNAFLSLLKTKKTVSYVGIGLKANLTVIEPKNSKRAYSMDYWHKIGNKWVKFSNIVSYFLSDIVKDFKEMAVIYEPNKIN